MTKVKIVVCAVCLAAIISVMLVFTTSVKIMADIQTNRYYNVRTAVSIARLASKSDYVYKDGSIKKLADITNVLSSTSEKELENMVSISNSESGFKQTGSTIQLTPPGSKINCMHINTKTFYDLTRKSTDSWPYMKWSMITNTSSKQYIFRKFCEDRNIITDTNGLCQVTWKGQKYYTVATTGKELYWRNNKNKPGLAEVGQTLIVHLANSDGSSGGELYAVVADIKSMTDASGAQTQIDSQEGHGYMDRASMTVEMSVIEFVVADSYRGGGNVMSVLPILRNKYVKSIELGEVIPYGK